MDNNEKIESLINLICSHQEFEKYYSLLVEFNKKVNLTAITEKNQIFVKHFLDSILPISEIKKGARVVDVGTGAGFPGLPIKIVRQDINLTLVDSLNKRINFLNGVCKNLNLKLDYEIKLVHARAEDFCLSGREKFDVATARAVAKLNTLLEYLLPLVKVGGYVFAYKGSNYKTELAESQNALEILGGKVEKVLTFNLPSSFNFENSRLADLHLDTDSLGERNIIVIKKIKPTPKQYPRGQNKPKTEPLC